MPENPVTREPIKVSDLLETWRSMYPSPSQRETVNEIERQMKEEQSASGEH